MFRKQGSADPSRRGCNTLTAIAVSVLAGLALLALPTAPSASAAVPELLWETPEDGAPGEDAGRFRFPGGVAADPETGHLFVADTGNARIVELSAWGEFVKAWGWGVVAAGPGNEPVRNERQRLTVSATAGTYQLTYLNIFDETKSIAQTTVPISFNWPAVDPGTPGTIDSVQEALEDLASLKASPGSLIVTGGPGDAGGTNPYEVEFSGEYADKDIPPLRVVATDSGGNPTLTGTATVATPQGGGSFEICVPEAGDVCQAGQMGGNAPGQVSSARRGVVRGVVVDGAGDVYVYEMHEPSEFGDGSSAHPEGVNARVQKFSPAGEFLAMWGGEVNKTKSAEPGSTEAERNLCTKAQVEAGDVCGRGVSGTGDGQFAATGALGTGIDLGPEGSVLVADSERIQRFGLSGAFQGQINVPGETVWALAIDDAGSLYASFQSANSGEGRVKKDVRKLAVAGEDVLEVAIFPAPEPVGIAVDATGSVYVVDVKGSLAGDRAKVLSFKPDGSPLIVFDAHFAESGSFNLNLATSEACGIPGSDLYVVDQGGFISAYGPAPTDLGNCPPPEVPPTIAKQSTIAVGTDNATLRARINPEFWNDTRYYVEYGADECASGGCEKAKPAAPGQLLTKAVIKQQLLTEAVLLSGLEPNTTYHYRFVAESSGGGPVLGPEMSFRTQAKPSAQVDGCANAAFRAGAGLPDCRAYELVSPLDKEGGDIAVLTQPNVGAPMSLNQTSPDGNRLTYSSSRAFGDADSAPISSTYLATRSGSGWATNGISPPRGRNTWAVSDGLDIQFKAFSGDLCESWLVEETDLPLVPGAPAGYANVYRRDNCGEGAGSYAALMPTAPEGFPAEGFRPEVQGVAEQSGTAIFRAPDKLTEDAISCEVPGVLGTCKWQLYESLPGGGLRAVCILPGGAPAPDGCSAGTINDAQEKHRTHSVDNTISADGSRIFWSDDAGGQGRIFLRIEGLITVPVSAAGEALSGLAGEGAQWLTAAEDGSTAIFSVGSLGGKADLYQYAVDGEVTEKITGQLYGLLGASEDAKRIYLVSGEALDGAAVAGKPNLYLYEAEGGFSFVATLAANDASPRPLPTSPYSPVNLLPKNRTARVGADGEHVAFMSSAPLAGFDNTDANSGEPDAQVFLYDAAEDELRCVSCSPTGALPSGRDIATGGAEFWAAAQIPTNQTQLYQSPEVLSTDGTRLYFESFDALEAADTNGRQDVYQWEEAGRGSCTEALSSFNPDAEGCVELISSGTSEDSSLVDVSASGNDVFIATAQSLVSWDPGLVDIYDVRVGGGFPPPPTPKVPCEGEACQSPPAPPQMPTPSSAGFRGAGNPKPPPKARKRCPKGTRKVRQRCVTRQSRKQSNRAKHDRRAQR